MARRQKRRRTRRLFSVRPARRRSHGRAMTPPTAVASPTWREEKGSRRTSRSSRTDFLPPGARPPRALPFLPHSLASWMAAWIASNWLEQDRSWSFDLTAHCPLRLSTTNWLSATLVKPAEQPDQQDDWDRDPDQPEQKTFTHCVLLFRLAHINVRWELRFHGMTRTESGEKSRVFASGVARARASR
ncbi:MAG: hypothetical protein QOD25_751 [Alphaproteobacteria bacterium]|nr:hypothetical protein [Alphaproteobacteria bacterium]